MASIVPSLSPAGSTMVRPCQLRAVSMLGGMQLPFCGVRWVVGWRTGRLDPVSCRGVPSSGRLAVATQPSGPLGRELLGGGLGVDRSSVSVIGGGLPGLLLELGARCSAVVVARSQYRCMV